ncbi:MAG: hypothetical protein KDC53_00465 [Saprospiraceae bacterium]|nr:hypothetical protein [Saprospiraceae bacterium]
MNKAQFLFFSLVWLIYSCESKTELTTPVSERLGDPKSIAIIDQAIEKHGGDRYHKHRIEFDFRDRHYISVRDAGDYQYERIFIDSTGQEIRDVLTNNSFIRYTNGAKTDITEERAKAYSNSVNSVIYFALLPYFLQDPAVRSSYVGSTTIENKPYDKVKITFGKDGGGKDFEDEFLYWFHQKEHTLDFLAYNYQTDGGGARFRRAINKRDIGGILFADYINYKPTEETMNILMFDSLYSNALMDSLSSIISANIVVK